MTKQNKEEFCLEKFKKTYKQFYKKYSLPDFDDLNRDFQIEKIAEIETDYFLREIRRFMSEKFISYLRFIESIINPVNVPMFVLSIVKAITSDDKKKLTQEYKKLAKIQVDLIQRDLDYSEQKEAEFIKDNFKVWKEIEKNILEITKTIDKNWDNKTQNNNRGYFG